LVYILFSRSANLCPYQGIAMRIPKSTALMILKTIAAFWFLFIVSPSTTSISGFVTLVMHTTTNNSSEKMAEALTINLIIAQNQTITSHFEFCY